MGDTCRSGTTSWRNSMLTSVTECLVFGRKSHILLRDSMRHGTHSVCYTHTGSNRRVVKRRRGSATRLLTHSLITMTSVRVLVLAVFLHLTLVFGVNGQLPFLPKAGSILKPLASGVPHSGASVTKAEDKYLLKAHLGQNELKFLKLGEAAAGQISSATNGLISSAPPAVEVSPGVLVS